MVHLQKHIKLWEILWIVHEFHFYCIIWQICRLTQWRLCSRHSKNALCVWIIITLWLYKQTNLFSHLDFLRVYACNFWVEEFWEYCLDIPRLASLQCLWWLQYLCVELQELWLWFGNETTTKVQEAGQPKMGGGAYYKHICVIFMFILCILNNKLYIIYHHMHK